MLKNNGSMRHISFSLFVLVVSICLTNCDSQRPPDLPLTQSRNPIPTFIGDSCPNLSINSLIGLKEADKTCVKSVVLTFNSKTFPREILECHNLEKLHLYNCYQLSKIPEGINQLQRLKSIYIFESSIDSIPESLAELLHLSSLTISFSKLKHLPKNFCDYKEVRHVSFLGNFIKEVPACVFGMPNLSNLNIFIADEKLTTNQRMALQELEKIKPSGFHFEY
jgi:Leucine-rich repeat (LRR) protein